MAHVNIGKDDLFLCTPVVSTEQTSLESVLHVVKKVLHCGLIFTLHLSLTGYLQCIDSATVSLVQKYSLQIQTLSYSQAIIPLTANQSVPEGCAVAIASDRCTVNLMLKVRAGNVLNCGGPLPSTMCTCVCLVFILASVATR